MTSNNQTEHYERLKIWSVSPLDGVVLGNREVWLISDFLRTLSCESDVNIDMVD